jgi:hypothetical protein
MTDEADYVASAKLRDTRFALLSRAIAVETELRDSAVIGALMAAIRADADQAMEDLFDVSPLDTNAVAFHIVKVRTLVYTRRVLNAVLRQGQAAEASIRAEDEHERDL